MFLLFIFTLLAVISVFRYAIPNVKISVLITGWTFLVLTLAILGLFKSQPSFLLFILLGAIGISYVILQESAKLNKNLRALIFIHLLRIPVEYGLYKLSVMGLVPVEMTFKGWNFDLYFAITAIPVYFLWVYKKGFADGIIFRIWNIVGILMLVHVLLLGILSSPVPFQAYSFDKPNIAVLDIPYATLPAVIVPLMLISHIILLRDKSSDQKIAEGSALNKEGSKT